MRRLSWIGCGRSRSLRRRDHCAQYAVRLAVTGLGKDAAGIGQGCGGAVFSRFFRFLSFLSLIVSLE
jgi:hypothetical protein